MAPPVNVTDSPTCQVEVRHHLDLYRNRHAKQPQRDNRDKTGQKYCAKCRVRLQQAEIEQPGLSIHYNALMRVFLNIHSMAAHANITK
ncbi:hypothetical protein LFZ31_26645 [Salmonella enterica subsp. enterica serovar Newport str. S09097]|nr:hypothetical protein LFZ31_26645 [Salmonella enterica subsp. enterica serovar Newport str. S09097]